MILFEMFIFVHFKKHFHRMTDNLEMNVSVI